MQQLLAPGVLSQQALSHALLELEEPLARYNASMSEVQQHLTAAAQVSKPPNAPSYQWFCERALMSAATPP